MSFEKIVKITPAFDKRDPNPSKDYGIHGCNLLMVLTGEKGAVQFLLFTNWQLPHVTKERKIRWQSPDDIHRLYEPMPADLGYHSPFPLWDGQQPASDSCEYCDGKPCYYDGSTLNADPVYEILLNEGSDGVWKRLEEYYYETFGGAP